MRTMTVSELIEECHQKARGFGYKELREAVKVIGPLRLLPDPPPPPDFEAMPLEDVCAWLDEATQYQWLLKRYGEQMYGRWNSGIHGLILTDHVDLAPDALRALAKAVASRLHAATRPSEEEG